jgi:hypothetical protein
MKSLTGIALNKHSRQDNRGLRQLDARLIYLFGDAATIEKLGSFLLECSKEMRGTAPFHRHFSHYQKGWSEDMLDVVIERPVTKETKKEMRQPWPNKSQVNTSCRK